VAITRWAVPAEQELGHLAAILGGTAYDLRLRIMGEPPVVLVNRLSPQSALALLNEIRARGHGAVVCDQTQVKASSEMFLPRDFSFGPETLTLTGHSNHPGIILAYDLIAALVLATQAIEVISEEQHKGKKFSAARTVATGGLVRSRKVKKQIRSEQAERESVLYLFCRTDPKHIFLQESRMHYLGLAEHKCPTRLDNFATLVRLLRERAPAALFDDRLSKHMRQTQFATSAGAASSSTTTHSNTSQNDLAAWLIALGTL